MTPRCTKPGCVRAQTMTGLCARHNEQEAKAEARWRDKQASDKRSRKGVVT